MKRLGAIYLATGVGTSIVTAAVLIKDGSDSPSKIAYYTTLNGLIWPLAMIAAVQKQRSLSL